MGAENSHRQNRDAGFHHDESNPGQARQKLSVETARSFGEDENLATRLQEPDEEDEAQAQLGPRDAVHPVVVVVEVEDLVQAQDARHPVVADPDNPGLVVLTGSSRVKGAEFSLAGMVAQGLNVSLGYTYLDGEIRNTTSAAPVGARLEQLPRHQLGIWNRFQLSKQFGLGLGAIYQDEQFASVSNTVKLPDYWRFDAAAYWDISERLSVQVNVENLFDETYYPSAHGNNNIQPATPFSARFGVRLKM